MERQNGVADNRPSWVTLGSQSFEQRTEVLRKKGCPAATPWLGADPRELVGATSCGGEW